LSFLDALNNLAGQPPSDGIRLDDRQRSFGHPPIIQTQHYGERP
jgi:hypothetical protein